MEKLSLSSNFFVFFLPFHARGGFEAQDHFFVMSLEYGQNGKAIKNFGNVKNFG